MRTIPPAVDQGNTQFCKAYAVAYCLHAAYGITFDVNWLMGILTPTETRIDQLLDAVKRYGALPVGDYSIPPTWTEQAREWVDQNRSKLAKTAAKYKIEQYERITSKDALCDAIKNGRYVVFSVSIKTARVDADGIYRPYSGTDYGMAHAMSAWYVNPDGTIRVLNSWGTKWGDNGQANMFVEDVLRGKEPDCWAFRVAGAKDAGAPNQDQGSKEDKTKTMRESKYVAGLGEGKLAVLRAEKETTSEKVGNLKNGDQVTVLAVDGNRALVTTGLAGWMDNRLLADKPPNAEVPDIGPEPAGEVAKIQWYLHKWGFGAIVGEIDGKMGSKTRAAIKQFQAAMSLGVDGIVGPKTWAALKGEIIVPRITEADMVCTCGKYCNGMPNASTIGVRILIERIWRELEKTYPGVMIYVTNNAHPTPDGAVAGGQRCERWNKERGGATSSQHLYGTAADIYGKLAGVKDSELRQEIENIALWLNTKGGVGYGAKYIVHVDIRGKKARWKY